MVGALSPPHCLSSAALLRVPPSPSESSHIVLVNEAVAATSQIAPPPHLHNLQTAVAPQHRTLPTLYSSVIPSSTPLSFHLRILRHSTLYSSVIELMLRARYGYLPIPTNSLPPPSSEYSSSTPGARWTGLLPRALPGAGDGVLPRC
ncbi:hypothetical protein B0H13DRAFT_2370970 [Mycena leptocephala]|nr:hypothetical protein B0H13DRAFT_2370970 [Mycena leptocephala]